MNLKDLAQRLGMSQTTVSRALNGYPEVSAQTRERVIAAAAEAGYRPNPVARRLATGRADAIGIIYPLGAADLGDPYFLEVVGGMTEALNRADMDLMIASASQSDEVRTYARMIEGRRIDGMVVARTKLDDPRLHYLVRKGIPFVAYGRSNLPDPYAWLDLDTAVGVRRAVERLVSLGHRRIALLGGPTDLYFVQQGRKGFLGAMAEAGLRVDPRYLVDGVLNQVGGYERMARLLLCDPRPTAVVIDNQICGVGALRALVDAGIEVGRDVSIIINDGSPPDPLMGYNVTATESAKPHDIGVRLIELMLALLGGTPADELQVLWEPKLKIGNTDGPCPG
ncbi:LacI family DNA-binding transcriptional regulator [Pararobbsia silviterrae]|uniref:LacI family DNA-binding transcriptional regulator n=2 Tax=Pararobbsia silviterrae TaxID=1792498 RepID=A0A494XIJ5_9BURK|nr:substrate-binding domain-containing protein [Pararobbsia silviterrae]RKP50388.1 LacI family DNA-binding transcriptional regulator [Pararobbsia silviterrae]